RGRVDAPDRRVVGAKGPRQPAAWATEGRKLLPHDTRRSSARCATSSPVLIAPARWTGGNADGLEAVERDRSDSVAPPGRLERDVLWRDDYAARAACERGVTMEAGNDPKRLYEVERGLYHAERPGFRIAELQISPSQKVPWHYHTSTQDTFFVLQGCLGIFLREPKEDIRLIPGETYTVRPQRPHLVTNVGGDSAVFFVLQFYGSGEY